MHEFGVAKDCTCEGCAVSDAWSVSTRPLLPLLARGAYRAMYPYIVLRCDESHLLLPHCKVESCESQSTAECCQCLHHICYRWSFGIRRDRRDSQVNVVDRSKDWYCCVTFVSFAKEVDHLQTVSGGSEKRDACRCASSANAVGTHSSTRSVCQAMSSSVETATVMSPRSTPTTKPCWINHMLLDSVASVESIARKIAGRKVADDHDGRCVASAMVEECERRLRGHRTEKRFLIVNKKKIISQFKIILFFRCWYLERLHPRFESIIRSGSDFGWAWTYFMTFSQ